MENLKEWLRVRGRALEPQARGFGVEPPRGLLLTGVPDAGSRSWRRRSLGVEDASGPARSGPPLRSVPRRVRTPARAGARHRRRDGTPRALGGRDREGFASGRRSATAGVATGPGLVPAMDAGAPARRVRRGDVQRRRGPAPEFMRRGRFDEVFFVDLPDAAERAAILTVQLRRRGGTRKGSMSPPSSGRRRLLGRRDRGSRRRGPLPRVR